MQVSRTPAKRRYLGNVTAESRYTGTLTSSCTGERATAGRDWSSAAAVTSPASDRDVMTAAQTLQRTTRCEHVTLEVQGGGVT